MNRPFPWKVTMGFLIATLLAVLVPPALAEDDEPIYINVEEAEADPDFGVQGEYVGDGWAAQVVALGDGAFEAYLLKGGLPGDGWDEETRRPLGGGWDGDAVILTEGDLRVEIANEQMQVAGLEGESRLALERVERESPTLGKQPPEEAIVLFDGSSADAWHGEMDEQNRLMQGAVSRQEFEDHVVHVEFLLPYRPHARGQGRGNSGIYVQSRYEVQMLDSFGLDPHHSHNGGIYSVRDPDLNMSYPPLTWQTYDIDFRAPRFDDDGNKRENARMTVHHNGVLIHDDVEVPNPTPASRLSDEGGPGPVYLQNHGNPVRYRNIWVIEQ